MLRNHGEIESFYREQLKQWGMTPRGLAWADGPEHYQRLWLAQRLVTIVYGRVPSRVLEVGCGYGVLPQYWEEAGDHVLEYTGVDLVAEAIERAASVYRKDPTKVFVCEPFEDFAVLEPYSLTVAIGVIAWQPSATAKAILMKMWGATKPGGLMLFTYLPGEPLVSQEINILRSMLSVRKWIETAGYAKSGERMVIFQKETEYDDAEQVTFDLKLYDGSDNSNYNGVTSPM